MVIKSAVKPAIRKRFSFTARWSLGRYQFLLFFCLAAILGYQVVFNPEIGFLKPALNGQWIVAPRDPANPLSIDYRTVRFRKDIRLPENARLKTPIFVCVTGSRNYRFYVNGLLQSGASEANLRRNWKFSNTYDIGKALHPGHNTVEAVVGNTTRSPALLVSGRIYFESGEAMRFDTGPSWRVSLSGGQWTDPEPIVREREFYPGHFDDSWARSGYGRFLKSAAALVTYLCIAAAFFLYRRKSSIEDSNSDAHTPANPKRILLLLLLFATLSFPMAWLRPAETGWDAQGHIDYVRFVATHWTVPLGEQGWQMYQPPAYYFLAAALYKCILPLSARIDLLSSSPDWLALKAIQLLTPILAMLQIVICLRTLSLFENGRNKQSPLIPLFVVMLPMQIYVSSFVSNEVFSSLTITLCLFLLLRMIGHRNWGLGASLLLGASVMLACLSKYTGLLMLATVCITYGVFFVRNTISRKALLSSFLIVAAIALVPASTFYFRNYSHYGKVLPSNQELSKISLYDYRGPAYYLDPSFAGMGAVDKFLSRTFSFVDGNYSSMWLDNSHRFYAWTRPFEIGTYFLAIFPTFLIAAGFCWAVLSLKRDTAISLLCFPVLVLFSLTVFAYLSYLLRIIGYETSRAFYLLSQITPLAIFLDYGMRGGGTFVLRWRRAWTVLMIVLFSAIALYYLLAPILIGKVI